MSSLAQFRALHDALDAARMCVAKIEDMLAADAMPPADYAEAHRAAGIALSLARVSLAQCRPDALDTITADVVSLAVAGEARVQHLRSLEIAS